MQAAVSHGADDPRVEDVPRPAPGPGEVLLEVERCRTCGTGSHIVRRRFPAPNLPLIIGHEFAGSHIVDSVRPLADVMEAIESVETDKSVKVQVQIGAAS
jgi:D-arabinose 1-dehydrogenase-like Zn-dependent alcohol dehydrogenase